MFSCGFERTIREKLIKEATKALREKVEQIVPIVQRWSDANLEEDHLEITDEQEDYDDEINEAISDAICNGDGRSTARGLRYELAKRDLIIVKA